MGWQGKPCPILWDSSVHRQEPPLCVHPPLQHWQDVVLNTFSLSFPFSASALCPCACVSVPGSTWAACTSQYLVSSGARALPPLCPGKMDGLEVPALLAQFRLGMPFGANLLVAPTHSASVHLVGWPRSAQAGCLVEESQLEDVLQEHPVCFPTQSTGPDCS